MVMNHQAASTGRLRSAERPVMRALLGERVTSSRASSVDHVLPYTEWE